MNILVAGIQIAEALLFFIAGITKLRDRDATSRALEGFGVRRYSKSIGVCLSVTEILVAYMMAIGRYKRSASYVCAAMLAIFSVAVARAASQGRNHHCNCFGSIGSMRVGRALILRNIGFTFAALLVATRTRRAPFRDLLELLPREIQTLVAYIAQTSSLYFDRSDTLLLFGLSTVLAASVTETSDSSNKVQAELSREREETLLLNRFAVKDEVGRVLSWTDVGRGADKTVILLVSTTCKSCREVLDRIDKLSTLKGRPVIIVVSPDGSPIVPLTRGEGQAKILYQSDVNLVRLLGVRMVPALVEVHRSGPLPFSIVYGPNRILSRFHETSEDSKAAISHR